jgi:uncharacterized protein
MRHDGAFVTSIENPEPLDSGWARLSLRPLPPYCFIPGRSPHPRRDPKGHSYGKPEPKTGGVTPEDWRSDELYLFGLDLYNLGYFWESHEALEALWHSAVDPVQRNFFQGLIQIAAANLKRKMGALSAAQALATRGLARLEDVPPIYMGVNVGALKGSARRYHLSAEEGAEPPALKLARSAEVGAKGP